MVKKASEKLISVLAVLFMCLALMPLLAFDGFAADGVSMRLDKLKEQFPSGYYYNHKVEKKQDTVVSLLQTRNEKYSSSVSRYPCVDHAGKAETGVYDCNYFDGGYQCHGFAAMLFYNIFGERQSELERVRNNAKAIKPGDLVRLKKDTHSAVVLTVKGNSFTVAECNVSENGETESCKIRWGGSYKLSDITYYIRAKNYDKVSADSSWKSLVKKENPGSSFYAAICNGEKALTLSGDKLVFKKYSGSASQIWKFTRQKNGSYKIISSKNGLAVEVVGAVKSGKAKLKTAKYTGEKSQLWAFYKSGKKYYLSADCGVSVLVAATDSSSRVDKKSTSSSRLFTLKKRSAPEASVLKVKGANGYASFTWSKGKNTSSFDLKIYDEASKLYKHFKKQKNTSLKVELSEGTYSAVIVSKNSYSETKSNTVHFTVGKKGELGKTAKVTATQTTSSVTLSWTAVPGADGYAIFQKTADGWKAVSVTEKTKATFKNLSAGSKFSLAIKACKKTKDGKFSPSKSYVTFTVATKPSATGKLTATQTTSDITLKWSAVKNADGYRVYKKTSSGWEKVATVSGIQYTLKKLSAGKNYTFTVKPFIKTTIGTVWGELTSLNTATAPKAPKVTVSDVKGLKATIRWDKVSGADGYQVYYKVATQKDYTKLGNYKSTEGGVSLSKLTVGTKYTFAVRAYKKVGGKTVYGEYSTVSFIAKLI